MYRVKFTSAYKRAYKKMKNEAWISPFLTRWWIVCDGVKNWLKGSRSCFDWQSPRFSGMPCKT